MVALNISGAKLQIWSRHTISLEDSIWQSKIKIFASGVNETFVKFVGPQPQKETLKLPVQKLDQQVKCGSKKFQNELIILTSLRQVLLMLKLFVVLTVLHIQKKQLAMTVQRFLDR